MVEKHPNVRNFLDQKDTIFIDIHRTCNSVYQELHSQGVGTDVRRTLGFTAEEEKLWATGVLDSTVFHTIRLDF